MRIIRQEIPLFAVPDFRNLGVALRVFASSMLLLLLLPILTPDQNTPYMVHFSNFAIWLAPAILMIISALWLLNRPIHRLPFPPFWVLFVTLSICSLCETFFTPIDIELNLRHLMIIAVYTLALMHYQAVLQKAFSPALAQAQLDALTARIRPHFLFNSLNAAVSLVHTRPYDAEEVLLNLADLFRAQLKSSGKDSSLGKEIELAQGYIAIEIMRMGSDRMACEWQINAPDNARVPHLLLQPLLENAVYHGVEPSLIKCTITVSIRHKGEWIYIRIENPIPPNDEQQEHVSGNKMALQNLSERLFLMYDRDAVLNRSEVGGVYRVDIRIPYRPYSV
ncbi:MAG: histidine kinase [Neisseriaceae bacterium]|nr:histidine kinase [Neisseriaceae bacterium]